MNISPRLQSKIFRGLKVFLFIFILAISFQHTKAQTQTQDKGIAISPAIMEFSGDPGQVLNGQVMLKNATDTDLTVRLYPRNFTSNNDNGAPVFQEKDLPFTASLADWIKLDKTEILVPKIEVSKSNTEVIKFSITIPANAEPGGYYAAIIANNKNAESTNIKNVQFLDSRGSLILLTVNGNIRKTLELVKFYTADTFSKDKHETNIFEWSPVSIITRLSNTGNTHIIPFGNILIFQGDTKVAEYKFNEDTGNILRESSRNFENIWGGTFLEMKPVTRNVNGQETVVKDDQGNVTTSLGVNLDKLANLHFGKFTAKLNIAFDANNTKQSIVAEYDFWIIPWKLILAVVIIIVLLLVVRKKLRERKHGH